MKKLFTLEIKAIRKSYVLPSKVPDWAAQTGTRLQRILSRGHGEAASQPLETQANIIIITLINSIIVTVIIMIIIIIIIITIIT